MIFLQAGHQKPYIELSSLSKSTAHGTFPLGLPLSPWVDCMVCDASQESGQMFWSVVILKSPVSDTGEHLTLSGLWLQPPPVNSDFVPVFFATNTPSRKDIHHPKFGDKIIEIRVWRWNEVHWCLLNISKSLGCFRRERRREKGGRERREREGKERGEKRERETKGRGLIIIFQLTMQSKNFLGS